jgi:hypothetical protein
MYKYKMLLIIFFVLLLSFMAIRFMFIFNKTIYLKTIDNNFRFSSGKNKFEK